MQAKQNIFLIILLAISFVANAGLEEQFSEANELYSKNQFEEAIIKYESILSQGYESADLYYNLGNAYFKSKQIPKSILYYERAKRIAPNDEDIRFNIEFANQMVVDKIEALPKPFFLKWGESILNLTTSKGWAVSSISIFILMLSFIGVYFFSRSVALRKLSFALAIVSLIFSFAAFSMAGKQKKKMIKHDHAIIFTPTVTVKSSPDESGTDLFVIHEGLKVQIKQNLGNWTEIRMANGNSGWIKKTDMEVI